MICEDATRAEIVEKYLLDQLSDDARESFEQHYFGCARCFGLLQTYREVQTELAATRTEALVEAPKRAWVWQWAWAPAMAVVLVAIIVAPWLRPPPDSPGSARPATSASPAPGPSTPPTSSLEELARFEPPRYSPGRLRGAADEATARFHDAMKNYARGDYRAAVPGLVAASRLDPEASHIHFYLGVSRLLTGQPALAVESLRRTIALGDPAQRENAHFYLAKAYLQTGNIDGAMKELTNTLELRGEQAAASERLLQQLRAFTSTQR
jgi:tetratricopeptide (TPR) repeat protein